MVFIGVCFGSLVTLIGILTDNDIVFRVLEGTLSIIPAFSGPNSFVRLMYRYRFAVRRPNEDGTLDLDSWGWNGCRVQLIGLFASIFLYPILIVIVNSRPTQVRRRD